jgi:hypothetical protein
VFPLTSENFDAPRGRKKKLCQFPLAQNSLQLAECEERNETHKHENGSESEFPSSASTEVSDTLGERLSMKEPGGCVFENSNAICGCYGPPIRS